MSKPKVDRVIGFSPFVLVALDCADKATGVQSQYLFPADAAWLWSVMAVGWLWLGLGVLRKGIP